MQFLKVLTPIAIGTVVFPSMASAQCWQEVAEMSMSAPNGWEAFGTAVSVSGDWAIVGAPEEDNNNGPVAGSVHFFERNKGGPNAWGKAIKKVVENGDGGDHLGFSVSISGNTAVGGAPYGSMYGSGSACVFERDLGGSNVWGQAALLVASDPEFGDFFGAAVALDQDTLVVGAPRDGLFSGTPTGSVYIFERDSGGSNSWGEEAKIIASEATGLFGGIVAIDADTIAVTGVSQSSSIETIYVFERNQGGPGAWGEVKKITAWDAEPNEWFGISLALQDDTLVVGAPKDDDMGLDAGAAYVFERNLGGNNAWGELLKLTLANGVPGDWFGHGASISGDTLIVGAPRQDSDFGAAYVYDRNLGVPQAWGMLTEIPGSPAAEIGWAVSISGTTFITNSWELPEYLVLAYERGSDAVRYCTPGTSGSGCQAIVTACGTPSATLPSGFTLTVEGLEGSSHGVFFFGSNGRQGNPWGNGTSFQCVVPPVHRAGVMKGVGTQGACDGYFSQDLNARWCPSCPKPQHNPGVGATVQAQLWYRDGGNTSNQTTSLSDAVEFVLGP